MEKTEKIIEALEKIKNTYIFLFQMEYVPSGKFLDEIYNKLVKFGKISDEDAKYDVGEFSKIIMTGGLGTLKRDLVKGFYDVMSEYWGRIEARRHLYVFSILYAKYIKGEGEIVSKGVKDITIVVRESLDRVRTYKEEINLNGIKDVYVEIYKNPFSEVNEYWIYCPEIFHEVYCGTPDDDFRAVQSLLYRKVVLRFIKELLWENLINENFDSNNKILLFSMSEVNTTLVIPYVVDDIYNKIYKDIRKNFPGFKNLIIHHYNHTIVPAGIPFYHDYMFSKLNISNEFSDCVHDGIVDLVKITGRVSDVITGCSKIHTNVLKETVFKEFKEKVVYDEVYGNSEGIDIEKWQGEKIKEIVKFYMNETKAKDYNELFIHLEENHLLKKRFIEEILNAKRFQKEKFIEEILKGSFGKIQEEIKTIDKIKTIDNPFFTMVRRLVDYKCADILLDAIEDEKFKEKIIKNNAIMFIGGRIFDEYGRKQKERVKEIIKKDSRMKHHLVFIENYNAFNSPIIYQGTNFTIMLSWKGKEAGPTGYAKGLVNGSPVIATPDGVIPEYLNLKEKYIVEYKNFSNGEILPDKNSLKEKIEEALNDYKYSYGTIVFNALKTGMTKCDVKNQAKGLLCIFAKSVENKSVV